VRTGVQNKLFKQLHGKKQARLYRRSREEAVRAKAEDPPSAKVLQLLSGRTQRASGVHL